MTATRIAVILAALAAGSAQAQPQMSNSISGDLNAGYGGAGGQSVATPGAIGSGLITTNPGSALPGMGAGGGGAGLDLTRQSPVPAGGNATPLIASDAGRGPVSGRGGDLTYGR